jgi:hypothetical protein
MLLYGDRVAFNTYQHVVESCMNVWTDYAQLIKTAIADSVVYRVDVILGHFFRICVCVCACLCLFMASIEASTSPFN